MSRLALGRLRLRRKMGLGANNLDQGVGWPSGAIAAGDFQSDRYMQDGSVVAAAAAYSITRVSVAYADNLAGDWASFAINALRRTNRGALIEPAETNIVPSPFDLSTWTERSATGTALGTTLQSLFTGAYNIASQGGLSNRLRGPSQISVVSGTPYYFRARFKAGSNPSGKLFAQIEAVSPATGVCSVSGSADRPTNDTLTCGTATSILSTLRNGVYELTFIFTPNFIGNCYVGLGPNSTTAGQNIIGIGMQGGLTKAGSPILGLATRAADVLTLKRSGSYDLRISCDNGQELWFANQSGDFIVDPATLPSERITSYAFFAAGSALLYGLSDIPANERVAA